MIDTSDILAHLRSAGLLDECEWTLREATGGLNNRVFFAIPEGGEPRYTVRLAELETGLDRQVDLWRELEGCPGVPTARLYDGVLFVHDYVAGEPRPLADVEPSRLADLAAALRCIHSHGRDFYTIWPSVESRYGTRADLFRDRLDSLNHYVAFRDGTWRGFDSRLPELHDRLHNLSLKGKSWESEEFAVLHGDLSIGNILWAERGVALIDWEYSRAGDPAEDLAYLFTEQQLAGEWSAEILARYLIAGGDHRDVERIPAYGLFTAVDSALWWVDYLLRQGIDPAGHPEVVARVEMASTWLQKYENLYGRPNTDE